MKVDQLLAGATPHDAIYESAVILQQLCREQGISGEIYAEHRTPGTAALPIESYKKTRSDSSNRDLAIYHYSTGCSIPRKLLMLRQRCITYYHNITPPELLDTPEQQNARLSCALGLAQMDLVRWLSDSSWAVSAFNRSQLQAFGFRKVQLLPLLRDYQKLESLAQEPTLPEIAALKEAQRPLILFVGRLTANKDQCGLVDLFAALKATGNVSPTPRLILVGSPQNGYDQLITERCQQHQLKFSDQLHQCGDADVIITGLIGEKSLAQLYRSAHVFLCFSDHEGFCVPLVEAMYLGLPVVAHDCPGVRETLGDGGTLIHKQHLQPVLRILGQLLQNPHERENHRRRGLVRAAHFGLAAGGQRLRQLLSSHSST